ncbi:site-specific integrase [Aliarcobacter cryaerophilus]|uniref:site-specific integrase n=1 Tax=Aliarcobacter cryaerophilus TaxID=28198 RepID=UPI0021B2EA8C|nr:site-specific integrase [Aliarcobacter cryaerophilus]MCT7508606.1 tyrosine-type recombinase/integrase [Aliarcobacter cryaerophilus]
MPKAKLTNTFVNKAKCPKDKTKIVYFDTTDTGFILEVRSTGTKTFYYRYNESGTTHQKKLSSADTLSANEARTLVQSIKQQDELNRPITINKSLSSTNQQSITLEDYWNKHYLPFIKTAKRSYKLDISYYKKHILPFFGKTPMNQITKADLTKHHIDLVSKYNLKKSTANHFIKFLSYAYNLAIQWELPYITSNPLTNIKQYKENNNREVYLDSHDIARLLKEADNYTNNINLATIIRFLLFTGCRRNEVFKARWEDIDLNHKVFTIPLSKSGTKRTIPISPSLEQLILTIPKTSKVYLFPSQSDKNKPINTIFRHWDRIRNKANLPSVRIHDLRHTTASILVNKGVSLYQVQQILGHTTPKMTQRYSHLSNTALREAVSVVDDVVGNKI